MLIEFSVENFKCVGGRQTLYFQPARKIKGDHLILDTGITREPHALPCVAILGPNASGKSTLLDALSYVKWITSTSHSRGKDSIYEDNRFKLNPRYRELPTSFSLTFVAKDGYLYCYELSLSPESIHAESLTCVKNIKGFKKVTLFERDANEITIDKLVHSDKDLLRMWKVDVNKQQTLLSYLSNKGGVDAFDHVRSWFSSLASIDNSDFPHFFTTQMIQDKAVSKANVMELLGAADFEIKDLKFEKQKADIPDSLTSFILDRIREDVLKDAGESSPKVHVDVQDMTTVKINFEHTSVNGDPVLLDFNTEESDGTKLFYSLAGPILYALKEGHILIVDELEKSLHPYLMRKIIQLFDNPKVNTNNAQLVFTTHDVTVLDKTLLRQDEIYFTEKSASEEETYLECQLYSLAEFRGMGKNDRGEKIYSGYLNGLYGAVPDINWDWRI